MVVILREADRDPIAGVAKKHGISEQRIYTWRRCFGAMQSDDARRQKHLETENSRLKKLVAKRDLEIEVMKEIAARNGERAGSSLRTRRAGACRNGGLQRGQTAFEPGLSHAFAFAARMKEQDAAARRVTERTAAVCGASALRPVTAPSRKGHRRQQPGWSPQV